MNRNIQCIFALQLIRLWGIYMPVMFKIMVENQKIPLENGIPLLGEKRFIIKIQEKSFRILCNFLLSTNLSARKTTIMRHGRYPHERIFIAPPNLLYLCRGNQQLPPHASSQYSPFLPNLQWYGQPLECDCMLLLRDLDVP